MTFKIVYNNCKMITSLRKAEITIYESGLFPKRNSLHCMWYNAKASGIIYSISINHPQSKKNTYLNVNTNVKTISFIRIVNVDEYFQSNICEFIGDFEEYLRAGVI